MECLEQKMQKEIDEIIRNKRREKDALRQELKKSGERPTVKHVSERHLKQRKTSICQMCAQKATQCQCGL